MNRPAIFRNFKPARNPSKTHVVIAVLMIGLAAVYFFFSAIVTSIVNQNISRMGEYRGHVERVSVDFWRGAFSVDELVLRKESDRKLPPFLEVKHADFNIQWSALLRGRIVGEVEIWGPSVNFVKSKDPEAKQTEFDYGLLQKKIQGLVPFDINRIRVHDGSVTFKDLDAKPQIDVSSRLIEVRAENLSNIQDKSQALKSTVTANGSIMTKGHFSVDLAVDPLAETPTFEMKNHLLAALPELNEFLKHYLAVDASGGRLEIFLEGAAAEGKFQGYVKPFMDNISVEKLDIEADSPGEFLKGMFVQAGTFLFKNRDKNDVATKVEFQGTFQNPDTDIIGAILNFFKNAFTDAILPSFDDSAEVTPQGELVNEEGEVVTAPQ